jgi:hypothetical protein
MTKTISENLGLIESTTDFIINIVYKKLGLLFLPDPEAYNTSCNQQILEKYDNDPLTRGKISFIPLDFLISYFGEGDGEGMSRIDRKEYLVSKLLNLPISSDFYKKKYKDVELSYFRKPYLSASLTKTVDRSKLYYETETENLENGSNPKLFNPAVDIVRNTKEWMSNKDILSLLPPLLKSLDFEKQKKIVFKGVLYIDTSSHFNKDFLFHNIAEKLNLKSVKEERFVMFSILYQSHFTCVFIDLALKTKDGRITKGAYFFNSTGFDVREFEKDPNIWFLDSALSLKRGDRVCIPTKTPDIGFKVLMEVLSKKLNITNFFFNTFSVQHLDSECGIFSSVFLISILNMIDKKTLDKITVSVVKHIYHGMTRRGGDKINSCYRGLFYFTDSDLEKNGISLKEYYNSPRVFPMKNEKFYLYKKMYESANNKLKNFFKTESVFVQ